MSAAQITSSTISYCNTDCSRNHRTNRGAKMGGRFSCVRLMLQQVCAIVAIVGLVGCSSGRTTFEASSSPSSVQHLDGETGIATLYLPGLGPQHVPYVVENGLPV